MAAKVSKSRSKASKQRDREDRRRAGKRRIPVAAVLLTILLWGSALAMIHVGGNFRHALLSIGQRAPVTIIAQTAFECEDSVRTEMNRRSAAEEVLPVFTVRQESLNTALKSFEKLFQRLITIRGEDGGERLKRREGEEALAAVLDLLDVSLKPSELTRMVPEEREQELRDVIKHSLSTAYQQGFVSPSDKETSFQGLATGGMITIADEDGDVSGPLPLENVLLPEEGLQAIVEMVLAGFPGKHHMNRSDLSALLRPWVTPNMTYDAQRTSTLRAQATERVETVATLIPAGAKLAEAGSRITADTHEKLRRHELALRKQETPLDRLFRIIGDGSLLLMALVVCAGLLQVMQPDTLRNASKIGLLLVLSLLALIPAKGLLYLTGTTNWLTPDLAKFLLPFALTALLATTLLDITAAMIIGIWTSFAAALLFGHSFSVFTIGLLVSTAAAHATAGIHRRSRIFRAGLWVALAEVLAVVTFAVVTQQMLVSIGLQAGAALLNGLVCAFIAILLIPAFEVMFGITTDITLLELSDMGNPILQRMAMEAPGTYHHSLMVANLGQAAAQEIGAHGLMVRVAAYYHDIGKLTKPEFFIENAQFRDNPHDDLAPSMSTLVVTSHVKEGVTLALRHKLPQLIIDAIQQHHGSGLVSYFYHRAKEQQKTDAAAAGSGNDHVKEGDFRYPGPKPQSREMAILALADSVEAASRAIDKPTPSRIENLVSEIVQGKIYDSQLDDCPLTMAELSAVKRSFVFTLTNMLHGRIAYPTDENRNKQQSGKAGDTNAGDSKAGATDHGTGTKA